MYFIRGLPKEPRANANEPEQLNPKTTPTLCHKSSTVKKNDLFYGYTDYEVRKWPVPSWLDGSVGKTTAPVSQRSCHGFKPHSSLTFLATLSTTT